ncbi:laccase precursor [Lindgomyces ingoldianus]|uniref:Laccase n=1 Tax=Lindgomyces ingoldianus TaxID=673940 RepID=A0ACB6REQ9_9PLEO|nr:laccase precursor [Lindgomyces ingoldianus]KAF2477734.1 laccase precursor [Lindgomyces ingoldianus]
MKSFLALAVSLLGLSATPVAGEVQYLWGEYGARMEKRIAPAVEKRSELVPRLEERQALACANGPTSRNCWSSGFNINTNMYQSWPNTGRIVSYDLSITNTTCNPDGHGARVCLLINNKLPGPVIIANWGDTLRITIRNKMQHNGTSIHWHGLRQLNSNIQDGANGVTECALAPGDAKTYQFRATEYGTSWYHSHFSGQYGDGVIGTIIINGPATANYDIDLGTYTLSDWYYITSFQAGARAFNFGLGGPPPTGDNILINGTNKNAQGGGAYSKVTLTPGKTHRLRLINTAVDASMRVALDNHTFTVIANDFVPVVPYTTNWIQIGIGQRYDVLITANKTSGNYWFRSDVEPNCQSANNGAGRAIFTYQGATVADPTTSPPINPPTGCNNPASTPKIALNVPSAQFASQAQTLPVAFGPVVTNGQNVVLWTINGTSMIVDPGKPTIKYIAEHNTSYPTSYNLVEVPSSSQWTYWIVQQAATAPPIAHPIHLHGHDFFILGTGSGQFSSSNLGQLTFTNPPRRDVAFLPGGGWLVLAYPTDNPGAWLMHCHIAFHVSMGLSVQFLERKSEISLPAVNSEWYNTCTNWNNYQRNKPVYPQDDSGLKKRWPPVVGGEFSGV